MKEAMMENLKRANCHPPMSDLIYPVPESFAGLNVLKIGRCTETLQETLFICDPMRGSTLLEGRALEYLAPAMGPELLDSNSRWTLFNHFEMLMEKLKLDQPEVARNLKVIDFVHHHDIWPGIQGQAIEYFGGMEPMMSSFLEVCVNANVMVKNVSASWFQHLPNPNPELGSVILSLVNLHPNVFLLDMTNLERLAIRQTSRSYVGTEFDWRPAGRRPEWPALKCLDVHVDSDRPQEPYGYVLPNRNFMYGSRFLLYFLFTGVTHLALTELRLSFVNCRFPTPNLEHVVASCPNLKKLVLVKWPCSHKALVTLWAGLPGLEEISLEFCQNLRLGSFVGGDQRNPVFLKLKNLKKLSLKGLDQIPKVKDSLFSVVIRHLSLTHFIVTSDGPVLSVTSAGVRSMLGSRFAESIQKFPFHTWSLANVASEEWNQLEKKFRSYKMLY